MHAVTSQLLKSEGATPSLYEKWGAFAPPAPPPPFSNTTVESLNRHRTTIKFSSIWSPERVTFLDTTGNPKGDGPIETDLHSGGRSYLWVVPFIKLNNY